MGLTGHRTLRIVQVEAEKKPRFPGLLQSPLPDSNHGLDPDQTFEKDTTLAKVDGVEMVFEHGMTLIGSREDLQARVEAPDAAGVNGV